MARQVPASDAGMACYDPAQQGDEMADHTTTTIAVRGCNIKMMRGGYRLLLHYPIKTVGY